MHRAAATLKPTALGIAGAIFLLVIYFSILTLVSGWEFALGQFVDFWYFIVSLAIGFGIQIGLYTYLRGAIHGQSASGKVVAVSGTTSTAAMISCCTHYLVNILPALGTAGIVTLVAQYQVELFWVGLIANGAGILYIGNKVLKFSAAHARTEPPAVAQA
jgi:P-type Cu+ transporter